MTRYSELLLSLLGVLLFPSIALAQTASPSGSTNQATRLATLHTACDDAISQRLASLNTLSTRIQGLQKLSASDKSNFLSQITADVNGLTSLKAKCDGDIDVPTLRTDYQSVFTQYRIYAVFIPQLNLLAASDVMGVTADLLSTYASKLAARIQASGNQSNLVSLLSDMQAKIADAKTQYASAQSQVISLTPNSFNTNPSGTKSTLQTAQGEIKTGAQDLKTAWSDAQQIRAGLKSQVKTTSPTLTTGQ